MLKWSERRLSPVTVGDCVAVFVPEFDRGKTDPLNIVGVIMEVDKNKKYYVGTKVGKIRNCLERTCFEVLKNRNLEVEDVTPSNQK